MKNQQVGQVQRPGQRPSNIVQVGDPLKRQYDTVTVTTTAYTVFGKTYVLVDDDTAGAGVTITLPPAINSTDKLLHIKKLGTTGSVTIDANASETIDGSTTLVISSQYGSTSLICDGASWHVI